MIGASPTLPLATITIVAPFLVFGLALVVFGVVAFVLARAGSELNARRNAGAWISGVFALLVTGVSGFVIVAWFRDPNGSLAALVALTTAVLSFVGGLLLLFTRTIWSFISPAERTEEATAHRRLLVVQRYVGAVCFALGVMGIMYFVVLRTVR